MMCSRVLWCIHVQKLYCLDMDKELWLYPIKAPSTNQFPPKMHEDSLIIYSSSKGRGRRDTLPGKINVVEQKHVT